MLQEILTLLPCSRRSLRRWQSCLQSQIGGEDLPSQRHADVDQLQMTVKPLPRCNCSSVESRTLHKDRGWLVQEPHTLTTQPHWELGSALGPSSVVSTRRAFSANQTDYKEMKEVNPDFKGEEQSCSPFLQTIKADCLTGIQLRQFIFQNSWQLQPLHNRVWDTGLLKERTLHQTVQMKPSASFSISNI